MDIPQNNKPIKYFKNNISRFLDKAAGSNRSQLQDWISDECAISKFHKNLKKEQLLTTLYDLDNSKMLSSFFHPPKVTNAANKEIALDEIVKCNGTNGVLISGSLGQGKSILLRYLQFIELNMGASIPIFIELRKIKGPGSIIDTACEKMNNLGLTCSNKLFSFLLAEGYVSIFMDGFDETPLEERDSLNEKLTNICLKYSKSKFIVTSRKNTEVNKNPNFQTFMISRTKESDHAPFIKKLLPNKDEHLPILKKITESDEFDYDVLDTPLLLTWFILVYKKRYVIPKTKLGFYEDLFGTILSRHDGAKDSFNRHSKSKLTDDEIKEVFCTLCYLSRKCEKSIFTKNEILDNIQLSLNTCGYNGIKPNEYLYDLTHVTCLLKLDGLDYEFIHESVAQYFSACFIAKSSEDNGKVFYTGRVTDWRKWDGEIGFLQFIDSLRYNKYLVLPSLKSSVVKVDGEKHLIKDCMKEVIKTSLLAGEIIDGKFQFISFVSSYSENYAIHKSLAFHTWSGATQFAGNFINKAIIENDKNKLVFDESLKDFLQFEISGFKYIHAHEIFQKLSLVNEFVNYMAPYVEKVLFKFYDEAAGIIDKEISKVGLFQ